jgi:MFS transporter, putative metabolite:H+ symporter
MSGDRALTAYQKKLMWFLSVATFFEGYDFYAMSQILPALRADFGLGRDDSGWLVATINAGTMVAAVLVRKADDWGRRRVLTVTIVGYTVCSLLSAAAPNVVTFAVAQLAARVFLIGEWAIAMVIAAEEFPAARRGWAIGVIQACSSLGSIVCAGVVPLLDKSPLGWRLVYLVGAVPLIIVAVARRGLRETQRFATAGATRRPFIDVMRTPYRVRILQLALIWCVLYVATQNAITFWKDFAIAERGWNDKQVSLSLTIASLVSMPLVFFSGRLLDVLGRRRGAVVIFGATAAGIAAAYTAHSHALLTVALVFGIFGASAVLPVMNAYTTELFPTELRGDAFAWANNVLGRFGYVLSPIGLGLLAEGRGWGPVLSWTALCPLISLALILALLPETRGRELEDTARL